MFDTRYYLQQHGTPVTREEANRLMATQTCIISGPGRVRLSLIQETPSGRIRRNYYCTYGTFPGNLAAGEPGHFCETDAGPFYRLTLRDLCIMHGFWWHPFCDPTILQYPHLANDYTVNFEEAFEYQVNSPYTKLDFQSNQTHKIWSDYFQNLHNTQGGQRD